MIITLTLNPSVDQTAWVERLVPGTVHRVLQTHLDPAGKGINVSRMVWTWDDVRALLPQVRLEELR